MMKQFDKVCIDANILIYATFPDFENDKHRKSLAILDTLAVSGKTLYTTSQILREFFAISTNSKIFKKPLSCKQATKKIREFLDCFNLICENEAAVVTLLKLLDRYPVLRQKIHDMSIVATMIENDISHILTFNCNDFKNVKEVSLIDLEADLGSHPHN